MIWHPGILTRYPTKNKQNRLSIDFTSVWFLPRYETKILSNSMYEIPQPYTNSKIGPFISYDKMPERPKSSKSEYKKAV